MTLHSVIVTKCDETEKYGNIISVLSKHKLPVSYITTSWKIPKGLIPLEKSKLCQLTGAEKIHDLGKCNEIDDDRKASPSQQLSYQSDFSPQDRATILKLSQHGWSPNDLARVTRRSISEIETILALGLEEQGEKNTSLWAGNQCH